jgi:membrane associated rhomboid family serine protease
MFMMPWIARLTRSSFPLGVILLVLINAFVFFGLQSRDEKRYELMVDYYAHSVLPALELPRFAAHLKRVGEAEKLKRFEQMEKARALFPAIRLMEADDIFMRELRGGRIITEAMPQFEDWQRARHQFEAMQQRLFTEKYAFDGEHPRWFTTLSHQFLHGDTGHIVGNMVVLILVAPAVEALLGTLPFLIVYLVGGLGAVGMHWLLSGGTGSLVGASGAISAVMGAFAVLLGMRRIPFFYFFFFFFDIIRASALLALPIWLANEAIQFLWLGGISHVAYGAHFGGLLAGALLVLPLRQRALARLGPEEDEESASEPGEAPLPVAELTLREARRLMAAQRFDDARRAYARAAQQAGADVQRLRECWNVVKLAPASAEYHALAVLVLALRGQDGVTRAFLREVFNAYVQQAKPLPRLAPEVLLLLIERFCSEQAWAELERAARLLQAAAPAHPELGSALNRAMRALREGGEPMRANALATLRPAAS